MSASSSRRIDKVEQVVISDACKPRWLEVLLKKTFFDTCETHSLHRNEMNRYCINCNRSACQYCVAIGTHRHHRILKIYRHVYKDVVSLASMEKHIDCSLIQPYKCNKRLVIALNPLPHNGSASNSEKLCEVCGRRLTDPDIYQYCSISCKVEAVARKLDDSTPPVITIQNHQENKEETSEPLKRQNKRKGTPCRAPFF